MTRRHPGVSPHGLFAFSVPIDPSKTIASVTLPDVGNHIGYQAPSRCTSSAMATRNTTTGTPEANGTTAAAATGQSWTGAWAEPRTRASTTSRAATSPTRPSASLSSPPCPVSTVRVKLDNALGTSKLSIGHATIAAGLRHRHTLPHTLRHDQYPEIRR